MDGGWKDVEFVTGVVGYFGREEGFYMCWISFWQWSVSSLASVWELILESG